MQSSHLKVSFILALGLGVAGCSDGDAGVLTYEEFKAQAYQEPDSGVFVINGDEAIENEARLQEIYESYLAEVSRARNDGHSTTEQALIINLVNNADDRWSSLTAMYLRYCVSQATFGANYTTIVNAMNQAAAAWEAVARVNFIHDSWRDGACNAATPGVIFDVNQVSFGLYDGRAFYPSYTRANRNLLIDARVFTVGVTPPVTLVGLLRHELGHALGFRHESARPEAGGGVCAEANNWRALTPYDVNSVMHYRDARCNGSTTLDYFLTANDQWGASQIYPPPPCPYYPCP